jgi:DDE family transposase
MGEGRKRALPVEFAKSVKLELYGARISSDAGLMLHLELDEVLGLTKTAEEVLSGIRTGKNTQHTLTALLRQSVYGRLAGYEDANDAERLRFDPTMRQVFGGRARNRFAASSSLMSRFETEMRVAGENLAALTDLSGEWIERANTRRKMKELILDLDSSVSPTHG